MPTRMTKEQIAAEADALRKLKPEVRKFTAFGGDNHASIYAQLYVLEHPDMDEDDIYDHDWTSDQTSAALEALMWIQGEAEESIVANWEPLAKKK